MATDLYKEAIAEAKALREMAEQNAKNKIIDVLTPQLRVMIERQLLGEQDDETTLDAEEIVADEPEAPESPSVPAPVAQALDAVVVDLDKMGDSSSETSVQVDPASGASVSIDASGGVNISSSGVDVEVGGDPESAPGEEDLILSTESAKALARLLKQPKVISQNEIASRLAVLVKEVRRLDRVLEGYKASKLTSLQRETIRNRYRKMLREAITLRNQIILSEVESNNNRLNERAELIFKEIKKMARRRKSALFDRIFESSMNEMDELEELDAVLSLEPADEEEAGEVEELLGDLEVEFELESPEGGEDEGGEDEGGEEMELGAEEEEEVIEIDESMLRRELLRMRRLREQEESKAADADPALAHGGEDEGDAFVEVSEDDLLNALADELGSVDDGAVEAPPAAVGAGDTDAMAEVRRRLSRRLAERRRGRSTRTNRSRVNESRTNRALKGKLLEYRKAVGSLKGQLDEMNLFNAKLLYANKLMQNRNVTPKQQRVIVEALDNAKTIREAKLLYKSLSASVNKKGGNLSEGRVRRSLGSASKSARSAQPIKEGAGVDRWAVLAGIPGKDNN